MLNIDNYCCTKLSQDELYSKYAHLIGSPFLSGPLNNEQASAKFEKIKKKTYPILLHKIGDNYFIATP
ncbi:hypothetical protein [Paraferrimonas sp. SM1919]|uniref:hypothetical protein n=1 Tax=Paraferrimonas sp. SM1919 TaxID=2662263 RepID=UPI0013D64A1D|nr:hypothetical protein [Paraferrimonas sp. SM1919]